MVVAARVSSRSFALGLCLCACAGSQEPAAAPPAIPAPAPPEVTTSVVDAAAPTSAGSPPPSAVSPLASAAPAEPPPAVTEEAPASSERPAGVVARSIGMHIGGGPNDAATKAPFLRTIEGGFDAVVACTRHVPADRRKGTFGIDLLVGKDGGRPEVTNPRTGIPGAEFRACVVAVFEGLAFERPKRGATKLSYSLRLGVE